MHRFTLLAIGKLKTPWVRDACAQYAQRLQGDVSMEVVELADSSAGDPHKQKEEESRTLLDAIAKRSGMVIVLSERGKSMSSTEFAGAVQNARDRGEPIIVVVGGSYGLTDEVLQKAAMVLAFGPMTFPHETCRVLILEQIYRAFQIAKGSGYHH